MFRLIVKLFLCATVAHSLHAEDISAPVILQYFESRYETIEERAPDVFKSGYGAIYTPPSNRADQGNFSVGYDPYDRFDLGGPGNYTLYGSETGLKQLVKITHQCAADYYLDFIINHNGYSTQNSTDGNGNNFFNAGGYPGVCISLPEAIDGDFNSAFDYGDINGRLAGLIDIDHARNFRFFRNPIPGFGPGADHGGNIRAGTQPAFGRLANIPDNNNRRFYPDRSLQPIMVFDPITNEQNIAVYPFNLGNPLNGTPVPENVTGYLMRNAQWLVQTVGVDGFRLDAAKHVQGFALDFYDRSVYRTSFRALHNGQQKSIFSFCEVFDGNKSFLQSFVVKSIDPNNPGRIGGNRDTLDFSLFFGLQDNLTGNGFQNSWFNIRNATLDTHDDGQHNGSSGVMFVNSHDSFGPHLSNVAHAYVLMHPGNALVYFNAQEFGTNRDFPKAGRGDALGGVFGNAIPGLVDIRNRYGRGNYVERWIEKENFAYERSGSCVVLLSNRLDSGFDSRTIMTNFNPGTRLIELTGNAASNTANPSHDVPELIEVNNDKTINVRFLRNVAPGTNNFTGNGYLIYGLPSPQGTLTFTNVASTLPGGALSPESNGTVRVNDIKVISANSFQIQLQTNAVNLLGSVREREADGDNALLRIDDGMDLNGNGRIDFVTPGSPAYGFEEFTTQHTPGYFSPNGNGLYTQTIDATKLSEGMHFITTRCFRHRDDGGPAVFTDFRQAIYIDRLKPLCAIDSFNPLVAGVNQNRQARVRSTDLSANNVHVFLDLPAALTDAQVIGMVTAGNQSGKIDRDLFAFGFNNLTNGNHVLTVVAFERTGNVNVQRFPGQYTSTLSGAGLGDANFDSQYSPADIDIFRSLIAGANAQFNPAADMNGDGLINAADLTPLGQTLNAVNANAATKQAYDQLVNDLSPFNTAPSAVSDSLNAVEDNPLQISSATLLANDSPGPGSERVQTITLTSVTSPSTQGGIVSLNNGIVTYTPPPQFNGSDTFTYTITDNGSSNGVPNPKSASAAVLLTVAEINDAPTANADNLTTAESTPLSVNSAILAANDSTGPPNESSQTLTVTAASPASVQGGSVSLNNGVVTYIPAANFNGIDSFTYVVTDNGTTSGAVDFKSAQGTVTVTVTEVNNPPSAAADALNAVENMPAIIAIATLLANDSKGPPNENAQTLTLTSVSANSTAGGTVAVNGANVVYTPPLGFNGNDTYTYNLSDNGTTGGQPDFKSASGLVNVSVGEVNHAPVANADSRAASLNTVATFSAAALALNDSPGPSNESTQMLIVTAVSTASAQGGTVNLNAGTITYSPPNNFLGSDSFTYTLSDNGTTAGANDFKTALGTVTVTVSDPSGNQPPVAGSDSVTAPESGVQMFTHASLLANDTRGPPAENGQTIVISAVSPTSIQGGTVALNASTITYTPPATFNGSDSFTYTITDNGTPPLSAAGTVFVTVTEFNNPPAANPDAAQTSEDTSASIAANVLTANDIPGPANEANQSLTLLSVSAASNQGGTVNLNAGIVTYTPPAHFSGIDTYTYILQDNGTTNGTPDFKSVQGTVTFSVSAVNDPPSAFPDNLSTLENTTLIVSLSALTANDSAGPANESTQTLTLSDLSVDSAKGGSITLVANQITYTPASGFFGSDSFTYSLTDNGTTSGAADPKSVLGMVTVTVAEANDPPVANADSFNTLEDAPLSVTVSDVLANDSAGPQNESDQTLSISSVSPLSANGGSVMLNGATILYTPPAHFNGIDTYTYILTDNGSSGNQADPRSSTGTVTITISEQNDAPSAQLDTASTPRDTPLILSVQTLLINDTRGPLNESAQTISVTRVDALSAKGGTVTFNAGQITYQPPAAFTGADSFTCSIADNGTTDGTPDPRSSTGTVTVSVGEVNQSPTAFPDSFETERNAALSVPASLLLANDVSGPASENAQTLNVSAVSPVSSMGGTVSLLGSAITYLPPLNYAGGDTFQYTLTDNGFSGGLPDPKSATGLVKINILNSNRAPIIAALTMSENSALIHQNIIFALNATDPDNDALTITWDFGDGSTATGPSVEHAFTTTGTYTISARVTDARGLSANASTLITVAQEGLVVTKMSVNLNFAPDKKSSDSIKMSGAVNVPFDLAIAGAPVSIDIGGIVQNFVLDKRGKSKTTDRRAQFSLSLKPKLGLSKFTLMLKKGSYSSELLDNGLVNQTVKNIGVSIPLKLVLDGRTFSLNKALRYSAKKDRTAIAK